MDIRTSLLEEHSKEQAQKIAGWIGDRPERFDELIGLMLEDEYRVAQRAAWVVTHCLDRHPHLIAPHLEKMVLNLRDKRQHDAIRRNTLRALQYVDIPESLWGEIADISFQLLTDPREPAAIRVFAMTVIWNICTHVPELKQELKLIIEDQWEHATAGFRSRGRKILQAMEKDQKRS
ncbi:hypothetical protein [Flavilitoribacter nigricans]|uniref:HEAT repeat domain-containing protein n=1 Tax=Flavilitoribacter nigricans (strain ATCC 23147 / DSM 23189 / NBRC 102662 / NCIMB 1420 / SS-2) TaxID=1122177 RepID=A0A2D0N4Z0_FLAN2|nr:hypothetical protein [Flavilitoribacter nigricans]PHN03565.1 hypothetical protein CRP01_26570 [Flavilitoribacter nigricans DSM 23189 = NBRC 102662]